MRLAQPSVRVRVQSLAPASIRSIWPQRLNWLVERVEAVECLLGSDLRPADVQSLPMLSWLRVVDLADAAVTADTIDIVSRLRSVESLSLFRLHPLDASSLAPLARMRQLRSLCVGDVPNDPSALLPLSQLTELESLRIWVAPTLSPRLEWLAPIRRLRELTMSSRSLAKLDHFGLPALPSLERLALELVELDEHALAGINNLPNLKHLALLSARLHPGATACLSGLGIEELDLSGSFLSDGHLRSLASMPRLRHLDLTYCRGLTAACAPLVGACRSLREVRSHDPAIRDACLAELQRTAATRAARSIRN